MEKKYITYLILSLLLVVISTGALNYVVDPLLYYEREKRLFQTLYTEELRYLTPGLIRNSKDYTAVIMGSSMAGNFLASEVSGSLNEKTIKLALDGATFLEQTFVLSRYFNTHPDTKMVIWGIDTVYIDKDPEKMTTHEYDYPFFLYKDSTVNLRYLLNYTATVHSLQTIANNLLGLRFFMKTRNLDQIHTWPSDTETGCKKVIEHYESTSRRYADVISQDFNKENAIINLNRLVNIMKNNRDVKFYVFLPPYSIVRYIFEKKFNGLERLLKSRNLFAYETKGISNVYIVDLQASEDIIGNLEYYKDMNHFNRAINNVIMKKIIDRKFDGYASILENTEKIRSFVETADFEKIRECTP